MICGTESNEPIKFECHGGEWRCVTTPTPNPATYDGTTLKGGPYDGMKLSDIPAGAVVYIDTTAKDTGEASTAEAAATDDSNDSNSESSDLLTKINSAVSWAVAIANDNSHGYSQSTRWGPSYDCSSLVISAWEQAGVLVKTAGATYTGNMLYAFLSCGFRDVTGSKVNPTTGAGLQKGDVLLNVSSHTAMAIGNGQVVHARSSEGTNDTKDGSGNEIRCQAFWSFPWNYVLRYEG